MILLYPAPPLEVGFLSDEELRRQLSLRQSAVLEFTGEDNVGYLITRENGRHGNGLCYSFLRLNGDGSVVGDETGYQAPDIQWAMLSAMDDWFYIDGDTELSWYRELKEAELELDLAAMARTRASSLRKLREKFPPKRALFEAQLPGAADTVDSLSAAE